MKCQQSFLKTTNMFKNFKHFYYNFSGKLSRNKVATEILIQRNLEQHNNQEVKREKSIEKKITDASEKVFQDKNGPSFIKTHNIYFDLPSRAIKKSCKDSRFDLKNA